MSDSRKRALPRTGKTVLGLEFPIDGILDRGEPGDFIAFRSQVIAAPDLDQGISLPNEKICWGYVQLRRDVVGLNLEQ